MNYKNKYLKYKSKYISLKKNLYGGADNKKPESEDETSDYFELPPESSPISPPEPSPDTTNYQLSFIQTALGAGIMTFQSMLGIFAASQPTTHPLPTTSSHPALGPPSPPHIDNEDDTPQTLEELLNEEEEGYVSSEDDD